VQDTTQYYAASSWVGIFATIWFAREKPQINEDRRPAESQRRRPLWGRRRQEASDGGAGNLGIVLHQPRHIVRPHAFTGAWRRPLTKQESPHRPAKAVVESPDVAGTQLRPISTAVPVDRKADSSAHVDLFPMPPESLDSVPDNLTASPVDAPQRLEDLTRSLRLRLLALPAPLELGHRSIAYRGRLERALADAELAVTRLADGTFGQCANCASPIPYNTLAGKPWTERCAHCALDL